MYGEDISGAFLSQSSLVGPVGDSLERRGASKIMMMNGEKLGNLNHTHLPSIP